MAKKVEEKKKEKTEQKKPLKTKKKDISVELETTPVADKETPVINEVENSEKEESKPKNSKKDFISGTGRRKTSVARVFLRQNKGEFIVNGVKADQYFPTDTDKVKWEKPFHTIGVSHPEAKFSATIKVSGSGKSSQLDAVVLGISRALSKVDAEFDKILRKQGFLTRDSRMVERKKPFLHKARKRPQYSKR